MAILGAVLGDILGAQYESNRPLNLDWKKVPLLGEGELSIMYEGRLPE